MRAARHAFNTNCVLFLVLAAHLAWCGASKEKNSKESESERLIREAYTISLGFAPEHRADLLLDILQVPNANAADVLKERSLELFALTRQMKLGSFRASMQKNALVSLSKVDPEKAAELYLTQDTPDMWNEDVISEDYRAFGARTLFPNLWNRSGMSSLPKIRTIANWIGSTGEYPYAAVLVVAEKVAQTNKPVAAQALVSDAINSFKANKGFLDRDQEFTDFILGIQKFVDVPLLREALDAELSSLDAETKDQNGQYTIQAADPEHKVQFNNQADYIAYRLLPLINEMDPSWAEQVKERYSVLRNLPPAPQTSQVRMTGVVVPPGQTASNSQIASAMDEQRLSQVTMFAQDDPKQAAEIAMTIQDPSRRAIAFATLAPFYAKVNKEQTTDWLKESKSELDRLPAGKRKLKLMVALAKNSLIGADDKQAIAMFEKAFDLGEEIFEEDLKSNPGKMAYYSEGEEELADLTESFAKPPTVRTSTISRIESIRDELLKAKLLVAAAKGIGTESLPVHDFNAKSKQ